MMGSFVHLHVHSEYSLMDSTIRISNLLDATGKKGMNAVALTDHNNMFGVLEFYRKSKELGMQAIIGCELCLEPPRRLDSDISEESHKSKTEKSQFIHLVLLCENLVGYRNLMKLATIAHLKRGKNEPHVRMEHIRKHHDGLILLTCCLEGANPPFPSHSKIEEAGQLALELVEIFGSDNFYLELQANGLPERLAINDCMVRLGREFRVPLVATGNVHYLNEREAGAYQVLRRMDPRRSDLDRNESVTPDGQLYLKSPDEMLREFSHVPDAIANTLVIAERCRFDIPLYDRQFPMVPSTSEETVNVRFEKAGLDGFDKRLQLLRGKRTAFTVNEQQVYEERLRYEMEIICKSGLTRYLLTVADYVNHAKNNDIAVGPGRGSAPGSLVAYFLGITEVDPIENGLIFERFFNPLCPVMPSILVDFCSRKRAEVLKYLVKKYGKERVAHLATFERMSGPNAVREVGRILGIPDVQVNEVAALILPHSPIRNSMGPGSALDKLRQDNPQISTLLEFASIMDGQVCGVSTLAAGVVIGDRPSVVIGNSPLSENAPLFLLRRNMRVTQCSSQHIRATGLLQYDLLGLRDLTVIQEALKTIKTYRHQELRLDEIRQDDPKTFSLLSRGDTTGVFQLNNKSIRDYLTKLRPDSIADIAALTALYRPGPIESGMLDDYIERKNGNLGSTPESEPTGPILESTYGMVIYQEQLMTIAHELAGYTMQEADILRRDMQRNDRSALKAQQERFVSGAKENGIDPEKAKALFDQLAGLSSYCFPKAHAAAYSLISYRMAYLKANYRIEFMAALLNCYRDNRSRLQGIVQECLGGGMQFSLPSDGTQKDCTIFGEQIRLGSRVVSKLPKATLEKLFGR